MNEEALQEIVAMVAKYSAPGFVVDENTSLFSTLDLDSLQLLELLEELGSRFHTPLLSQLADVRLIETPQKICQFIAAQYDSGTVVPSEH